MAAFNYNGSVVIWSALPYGEAVEDALKLLTGSETLNVTHLIIPDKEHTLAAVSFKEKYPDLKIIAMEGVDLGSVKIDYTVTDKYAHKLLDKSVLAEIGITDPVILDNFQFVYLPKHANKELVAYEKNSKIVFEADLLFNLRKDQSLEQFSPETGYPKDYFPHGGLSYPTRYMNPDSKVGIFLLNKIANSAASAEGLRTIYGWDFDQMVMCHGNIFTSGAKAEFKKVFGKVVD